MGPSVSLRSALSLLALGNTVGVSATTWFNWQYDITCTSTGSYAPVDEADLVQFVKDHAESKTFLKAVGTSGGFGNLTTCINAEDTDRDSYIVSLTNFNDFSVGENNTVTFGAGWDLVDLVPELLANGLQLPSGPSQRVHNYVGLATASSHGSGKLQGNMASYIVGLRVVDAAGEIHVIDHTTPDLLKAFKISLGALGLITQVTVQAEPLTYLKRSIFMHTVTDNATQLYTDIKGYYEQYDALEFQGPTYEYDDTTDSWSLAQDMRVLVWEETDITDVHNCTDYCTGGCGDCSRSFSCIDYAPYARTVPPGGICSRTFLSQFDHFFPVENLVDSAVGHWNLAVEQAPRMVGLPNGQVTTGVRFVKGDDALLSPVNTDNLDSSNSGIFATLETTWTPSYNNWEAQYQYQEFVSEYLPTLGETYNIRPHWNKGGWFNSTYAPIIYPQVQKWLDVQEQMDPNCQFVNPFLVNHLGIERCRDIVKA